MNKSTYILYVSYITHRPISLEQIFQSMQRFKRQVVVRVDKIGLQNVSIDFIFRREDFRSGGSSEFILT